MKTIEHEVDFAVIGGGIAGICAALAAARNGAKVLLMHDRPVLGGNASSEIRMWICGAHGRDRRETGIIEELLLENLHCNQEGNYSIWDSVLYGKVNFEPNLKLLLNTSCLEAQMDGSRIAAVTGWQLNTETRHTVKAKLFADCSGDSILVPLTGAEARCGREARAEFDEDIAPERADRQTMGMSCLVQARETAEPHDFIRPEWANVYTSIDEFPHRPIEPEGLQNYWWIELGGAGDALHDVDETRDELLKIGFGLWDFLKNGPETREKYRNWELEWVGFLPGKRESRRYVGDLIMTQNDVRAGGDFPDVVAYGGWTMDDHHPDGFRHPGPPTTFHPAPSPYGIPYRTLYSRNVENLFCAGRNISVTHSALSSTRVMATCGLLGHAVGVAAAIAARAGGGPRDVYRRHLDELQQRLMREDAWLPGRCYAPEPAVAAARLRATAGDPAGLRLGLNRVIDGVDHSWHAVPGAAATYEFNAPQRVESVRIVFDSDLDRPEKNIVALRRLDTPRYRLPDTLAKRFRLEAKTPDGAWRTVHEVDDNRRRVVELPVGSVCAALRLTILTGRGSAAIRVFAWDFSTGK
jgi:hypothetical protein